MGGVSGALTLEKVVCGIRSFDLNVEQTFRLHNAPICRPIQTAVGFLGDLARES